MSLLTSTNAGSASTAYFIQNVSTDNGVPSIGTAAGEVQVQTSGAIANITTDRVAAGTLRLGSSQTSFQNIALTDGTTTVNGTLSVPGAGDLFVGDDITLGGDLIFSNGATGASISGYYFDSVPVAAVGAIANPAGLTAGVYHVVYVAPGAGNENAQPSGVFIRSATTWFGNAVSTNFTAGAPNAAISPVAGGATLQLLQGGAGTAPVPGDVFFRKLAN